MTLDIRRISWDWLRYPFTKRKDFQGQKKTKLKAFSEGQVNTVNTVPQAGEHLTGWIILNPDPKIHPNRTCLKFYTKPMCFKEKIFEFKQQIKQQEISIVFLEHYNMKYPTTATKSKHLLGRFWTTNEFLWICISVAFTSLICIF